MGKIRDRCSAADSPAARSEAPTLDRMSDERPTVIEFEIGAAFPSDQPLVRWITALTMSHNDVRHGNLRLIEADEEDAATRLNYLRLVASHFYETQPTSSETAPSGRRCGRSSSASRSRRGTI